MIRYLRKIWLDYFGKMVFRGSFRYVLSLVSLCFESLGEAGEVLKNARSGYAWRGGTAEKAVVLDELCFQGCWDWRGRQKD